MQRQVHGAVMQRQVHGAVMQRLGLVASMH